jgi:hypothetical protein
LVRYRALDAAAVECPAYVRISQGWSFVCCGVPEESRAERAISWGESVM